jgi:glycosyltransferase involved in cell wall biosynthesis
MNSQEPPAISIIVPVFNSEKDISNCVDSILSQSFKNFECILIDDGSTDNSLTLCEHYSKIDNRVKVISQKNSGVSSARNSGIKKSLGKYISFVDSDDLIMPEIYRILYKKITTENCDVVCCGFVHKETVYSLNTENYTTSQAETVFHLEAAGLFGTIWNKLYKSDIIKRYNILFSPGHSFGEDFLFNLTYFSFIHNAVCIEDILYIYNVNEQSISKRRPNLAQSLFRFRNINRQILQLTEYKHEHFHNRILALDFTYTVFLIRNLYIPSKLRRYKRFKLLQEIKSFYFANPALYFFRSLKYRFFYLFFINTPLMLFDLMCLSFFSLVYIKRKYV